MKGLYISSAMTVLIANNVSLLNKEANAMVYSSEDLKRIKQIAGRDDTFELLSRSLAPSIYGHAWIKKVIILLILSGTEKNLKNGTHLRGTQRLDVVVVVVEDKTGIDPATISSFKFRVGLHLFKQDRADKFGYCLPYFYRPDKEEEPLKSTILKIVYPAEPHPELTDLLIAEKSLTEDQKDAFKEHVKEKVQEETLSN